MVHTNKHGLEGQRAQAGSQQKTIRFAVGTWSVIIFSWPAMRLLRVFAEDKSHMGMFSQDSGRQ